MKELIRIFVVVLMVTAMTGCDILSAACSHDLSIVALRELRSRGIDSSSGIHAWLYPESAAAEIGRYRHEIARVRVWLATQNDRCLRSAYEDWFDYHERGYQEAENELRTHAIQRHQDAYRRERETEDARVEQLRRATPKPPVR